MDRRSTLLTIWLLSFCIISPQKGASQESGAMPHLKTNEGFDDARTLQSPQDNAPSDRNSRISSADIPRNKVRVQQGINICEDEPSCEETNYRSIDGSCNNLNNPIWGRALTVYPRWLPPMYDDGVNLPRRRGKNGRQLPGPRVISSTLMIDINRPNKRLTHLGNLFGQFLAHEMTGAAGANDTACCDGENVVSLTPEHPDCFSIPIPRNDNFFSQFGKRCMPLTRSLSAEELGCNLRTRQQVNIISAFLDSSNVYGSRLDLANNLRSFEGGKLRSSPVGGPDVPPPKENDRFNLKPDDPPKFLTGDGRSNQNLLLSCHHILWFREHNRVAGRLERMNPDWDDETIYQEARRIVGAEFQHIVYNEYLPTILGQNTVEEYDLLPQPCGFTFNYDEDEDPSIGNTFSAAAFRFGHSLVQGELSLVSRNNRPAGFIELAKQFNRPVILYEQEAFEQLVRGGAGQPAQGFDNFFTTGLTNHLVQRMDLPFGLDLVSINIQRGRDQGVPTFRQWRGYCGLQDFKSFDDMYSFMTQRSVDTLRQLYSDSADIDLYAGMFGEIPNPGEMLGPTVHCFLGKQFRSLKLGDRFWYENGGMSTSFTEAQVNTIKNVTLARIICDNTAIQQLQPQSFVIPDNSNRLVQCIGGPIPRIDLNLWSSRAGYSPI